MGAPTSSYATTGIDLRVSGALKPHHHYKVETPSVGNFIDRYQNLEESADGISRVEGSSSATLTLIYQISRNHNPKNHFNIHRRENLIISDMMHEDCRTADADSLLRVDFVHCARNA
jgi:hypothetical protein